MIKVILFFLVFFQSSYALAANGDLEHVPSVFEQEANGNHGDALNDADSSNTPVNELDNNSGDSNATSSTSSFSKNLIDFIVGEEAKDGILYLPIGIHPTDINTGTFRHHLIGVAYNSFLFTTFINSRDDRVWGIGLNRNIISYHGFGLGYFVGAGYGYKGHLSTLKGIPFRDTFLFKSNLSPLASINAQYELSDHLQLQVISAVLVVIVGIKYNF